MKISVHFQNWTLIPRSIIIIIAWYMVYYSLDRPDSSGSLWPQFRDWKSPPFRPVPDSSHRFLEATLSLHLNFNFFNFWAFIGNVDCTLFKRNICTELIFTQVYILLAEISIFIMVQKGTLMMFSLNMLDYPMSFLALPTWPWNTFQTLRGTWALNHVILILKGLLSQQ